MRVLVMSQSRFLLRGLCAELEDHGVEVAGGVRSVAELATALPASDVDAAVVCLSGAAAEVRPCLHALVSVMAEHPETALLLLASSRPRTLLSSPRWGYLPVETAVTDTVLTALVRLAAMSPTPSRRSAAMLTHGERQVLDLLASGLSNGGIAVHLGVSLKTVETHVTNVFGKLGLDDRDHTTNRRVVAALRWARA